MVTVIIGAVIGAVIGVIVSYKRFDCIEEISSYLLSVVLGVLGALTGGFVGFLIALYIPSKTETIIDTYYLEALQDNNNSETSSLFLGSGYINGEMKYVFYYETDGGYKMKQLSYDNALIKYTNETPKVETYREEQTDAFINKFSVYMGSCGCNNKNIIYVPKGTIKNNYNLDVQ